MNNPFSRLKRFLPDKNDPQENHATECLAACLVFSPRIRASFIRFLFGLVQQLPFELGQESKAEVLTQLTIEDGWIDLVLRQERDFAIAVEVKVSAPENCFHRDQLAKYRKWLNKENQNHGYLFTLVKNPDSLFKPKEFEVDDRRSWRELYNHFHSKCTQQNLSEVEDNLLINFIKYLESEGIVSNYETKDLLCYGKGIKAQNGTVAILNQVSDRLRSDGFSSVLDAKSDWPLLKIEHPDWKDIFGQGQNQKISLWFMVEGVWEAKCNDFGFDIELWNMEHKNAWPVAKSKLPKWLNILKAQGLKWTVCETWKRGRENVSADEIQEKPKRIHAYRTGDNIILDQNDPQPEDQLIDLLVQKTKEYAEIIGSLK